MSKFFFDGKANNNNERGKKRVGGGDRILKLGTKKSPAQISVQNEARKVEIDAIIAKNQWFADIKIDADAPENIKDLEFLQDNKVVSVATKKAGRNDPCPCGSGKKFKKCCA
ncbi:MAG: SEC-C metal-binding domain-containing protein [Enterobacterales bacterium]|nr:SEC-C metal-binding domain-containing protein [Enterobacterales bacterium]